MHLLGAAEQGFGESPGQGPTPSCRREKERMRIYIGGLRDHSPCLIPAEASLNQTVLEKTLVFAWGMGLYRGKRPGFGARPVTCVNWGK